MQRRQIVKGAGLFALLGSPLSVVLGASSAPVQANVGPYVWKSVPYGAGGFIDGFVFHPRESGLLYARTDIGGAYRFDPATKTWVPLLDHLSRADADLMGVLSLAVDPNDANRLYAACGLYLGDWARKGALLTSTDRGVTWNVNELGFRLAGNGGGRGTGERLQVDPNKGDILWLGSSQDGLWASRDQGKTFSHLDFAVQHVSLVLFDPRSGEHGTASKSVYVGSNDKPGLYVSHDAGLSFVREPGTPEQVPQRAVFAADGTLYVSFALGDARWGAGNPGNTTTGGVWKRDPGGKWTDITPVKPGKDNSNFGYSGLDVDARVPGRLLVSTIERWYPGDEVFVSTDGGVNWTPLGAHSKHDASAYPWLVNFTRGQDKMGHWISDVKIDPFNSERAVYGTGYGLWLTHNLGSAQKGGVVNWDFTVTNLEETATPEIKSPSGGATLLGAMADVSGGAWDDLAKTPSTGLFTPTSETNRSVDFAELNPGIIARTADQVKTGGYWSPDGGVSWLSFGPSARLTKSATGDSLQAGNIAVSAKGGYFVWAPQKQAAMFSRDHGKNWTESQGWPASREVELVPVADRAIEGVFYVYDRDNGQILVSIDGGQSFKSSVTSLPKVESWQPVQLIAAPGAVRDLWLALPNVLMHFPGLDKSAQPLTAVAEPWKIALGKGAPGAAYHSLYVWGKVSTGGGPVEGLFRSDDVGQSFKRINDDAHRYGTLLSMTADPLEHGTVFLAPHGRGIVVGRPRSSP